MPKLRVLVLFLAAALPAVAQQSMTAPEVIGFVKSEIQFKRDDRTTADYLKKVKLTQKLSDGDVDELKGLGAGPRTVATLRKLAQDSTSLPEPLPPPAPKAAVQYGGPPPDSVEQGEVVSAMRDYALSYTANLPNYICIQTTRRQIDPTSPRSRARSDVIQEQLSFYDKKETYKVTMVNGSAVTNAEHEKLGGVISSGEFGSMLGSIFSPETEARFDWDHWGKLRDRLMYVFAFSIEREHGYHMYSSEVNREYVSAYHGLVYADKETKVIMRIQMECEGIPSDFPVRAVSMTLDYKPTEIAGNSYVLPYHMQLDSRLKEGLSKNEADFKMYRMYGSESTIKFTDSEPVPENELKEQPAAPVKKKP